MRELTAAEKAWIAVFALEPLEPTGGRSAFGNGLFWGLILSSGLWLVIILMLVQALEG